MTNQLKSTNDEVVLNIQLPNANLQVTPQFDAILAEIPQLNQESKALQTSDLDQLDETQLNTLSTKMANVAKFNKQFQEAERAIKATYNEPRDRVLKWFHNKLAAAGYEEFELNLNRNKQLKRDILANRANHRWVELKRLFNDTLAAYPELVRLAPQLANFDNYRANHPKLVSGAKNKNVTDKMRATITNDLAEYAKNIQTIQENANGLLPPYQQQLIKAYTYQPTAETIVETSHQLLTRQKLDLLAQKQTQQKQPNSTAKSTSTPVMPRTNDFSWLLDYINTFPNGQSIHANDKVKANVIYDLYHRFTQKDSVWYPHIQGDPSKLILLTQRILDL